MRNEINIYAPDNCFTVFVYDIVRPDEPYERVGVKTANRFYPIPGDRFLLDDGRGFEVVQRFITQKGSELGTVVLRGKWVSEAGDT
jgi:hypothetical protein